MKRVCIVLGLLVALIAGSTAYGEIVITLVPQGGGCPQSEIITCNQPFLVDVLVDSDISLAMVQVVLDLPPCLELLDVTSSISGLSFVNPPDTAVADYYPDTYPLVPPGTFTAMTLEMICVPPCDCSEWKPIDLVLMDLSTFSTVVFDENYEPIWDVTVVGARVLCIPEPASMGLLALVALGGVVARRRK